MNVKTHEHGRFYTGLNGHPRFAGSASGVYLMDTIRNELTTSNHRVNGILEAFLSKFETTSGGSQDVHGDYRSLLQPIACSDIAEIRARFNIYFRHWHPLFPFLDGKAVHNRLENILQRAESSSAGFNLTFDSMDDVNGLVWMILLRVIRTIGGLGRPTKSGISTIERAGEAMSLAYLVLDANDASTIDDVVTVQALFALQLTMYARGWYRPAARLSAITIKIMLEAGLHRCPCRYPSTFQSDALRDLRKRIFFSVFVLDRILSADFGLPLLMRQTDIDVCLPGAVELHGNTPPSDGRKEVDAESPSSAGQKRKRSGQQTTNTPIDVYPSNPEGTYSETSPARTPQKAPAAKDRLLPARTMAKFAILVGRIVETFNRSRRWRTADPEDALRIRTELDDWWLELDRSSVDTHPSSDPLGPHIVLFQCLYHQQLIRINRHSLSLPATSIHHRHALQSTVIAAKAIATCLESGLTNDQQYFKWPGYADMLLDAALLFAYAATLSVGGGQSGYVVYTIVC
ncbi:fungal-specific transcription factor domain-domain-containing protein [Kockovaella imperatae]|uniref:Fungal-specific transcription factor domain-domain-containing protein n=1 Tax=Kockovaella imperatae TaxID=4999 RepID=A0A1Y1UHH0_9TREE|nr:fungal-specific transcription factor domain-domain-containing protein [Kockovaella imperatae]ORX36924.1 fungal-specific transcription factor domain-domain-containing protein [Kockovaella imperatae]